MKKFIGISAFLLIIYAVLLAADAGARTESNHFNLARRIGMYGILSLGAGMLIVTGGIDLSIGSVVGLSATVFAMLLRGETHMGQWVHRVAARLPSWLRDGSAYLDKYLPDRLISFLNRSIDRIDGPWLMPALCVLSVLVLGVLVGWINGMLVTKVRVQAFVVTLCGLFVYRGVSRWLAEDQVKGLGNAHENLRDVLYRDTYPFGGRIFWIALLAVLILTLALCALRIVRAARAGRAWPVGSTIAAVLAEAISVLPVYGIVSEQFLDRRLVIFDVPTSFVFFFVIALAATVFLHFSIHGRYFFAIGANEKAAKYSGVETDRYKLLAYVLCSTLAAFYGILFLMQENSSQPSSTGNFLELYAIAGAVLGGCSLRGGEGSVAGVIIGTSIFVLLPNLSTMLGINPTLEYTVLGGALLMGTILDEVLRRFGKRST